MSLGLFRHPTGWPSMRHFFCIARSQLCYLLKFLSGLFFSKRPEIHQTTPKHVLVHSHPLTDNQRDNLRNAFISSIDKEAIRRLARRYNQQQQCDIIATLHGSYNVSFVVQFLSDQHKWVVRIPINPLVSRVIEKHQSEIATMLEIQQKTTIPIPKIHAFDECEDFFPGVKNPYPFLIYDYVPGETLSIEEILQRPLSKQQTFFAELDGILTQLHDLRFSHTGSLAPSDGRVYEAVIGPPQSLNQNDVEVKTGHKTNRTTEIRNPMDIVNYLFADLVDVMSLPDIYSSQESLQREIFAIEDIARLLPTCFGNEQDTGLYSLSHMDMRCQNLIVDKDLHIRAVLDWEWAMVLPNQLCVPPAWLDSTRVSRYDKSKESDITLAVAQILREPHSLFDIYFTSIFPLRYKQPIREIVEHYFKDPARLGALQDKLKASQEYRDFLEANGLLTEEEIKYLNFIDSCDDILQRSQATSL